MSTKGKRLDLLLEERGFFASRQIAKTAIMDGGVIVNGAKVTKPGSITKDDAKIEITNNWLPQKYVSRGGLKLEKALNAFALDVSGKICVDVGASTGGFTDCLLQANASFVYAVDVGYGQIAWSLRTDKRVKVIERVNARSLTVQLLRDSVEEYLQAELAVIDVSFISLSKVLPAVKQCLSNNGQIIALVKPQFEAGPENIGKNGVVRSPEIHALVLERIVAAAEELGIFSENLTFSPLKGPQGNIEFLLLLKMSASSNVDQKKIAEIVAEAHTTLKRKSESEAAET